MRKTLFTRRSAAFLLAAVLVLSLFTLAGCGRESSPESASGKAVKTKTLTYKGDVFQVSVKVPEDSSYKFSDKAPEAVADMVSDSEQYLTGDDLVVGIRSTYYTSNTGSFDAYRKYVEENHTLTGMKDDTFAGRDAIRSDFRYGASPAPLYGYTYTVDISEIADYLNLTFDVLPASGKENEIRDLLKDKSVKAVIDSIKVTKLS